MKWGLTMKTSHCVNHLTKKNQAIQRFQEKPKQEIGKQWTEERKKANRRRMKENWAEVRSK